MNKKIISPALFALFLLVSCGGGGNSSLKPITPGSSNSTPSSQPSSQPDSDPTSDPGTEQTSDPGTEQTSDPASDPGTEQTSDPASDPASDPTSDPASSQPAQRKTYLFEAEYCPCIEEMEGATYSGGTSSYGLIGKDRDNAGASGGCYVHFMYVQGSELVFNIVSDAEVDDVTFVARFSAEYRDITFNEEIFPIEVNEIPYDYGTISITNVPMNGAGTKEFQDYTLIEDLHFNKGNNEIIFRTDNNILMYGTAMSTAPMIDCIKLTTSATLTWPEACPENLDQLG
ncbi:MAG: hypothetical protein J5736_02620 [Bacilli bacterium]|nr:hypothetical protein [Bacilli bacterium]